MPSGLPLAREIEKAVSASADTDVFVLGNHGLVIGADHCDAIDVDDFVAVKGVLRP